ncbi:CbrC family protein [Stenotrophomonas cyclobalanopsidis]|uniref:CbrC family protein n=1 Tax=Stenotrophomonas cyclobalanopsidis TaxID=2771362 RepID=UPI003460E227
MDLPRFPYHPDPIDTGSVVAANTPCVCCGQSRGYVYTGPVYAEEEYGRDICPWCIADGSAHERLGVTFSDEEGVGGGGEWDEVDEEIIDVIAQRTPGFNGWQQEQWWTHCGDAAQFIGRAGRAELEAHGEAALAAIQDSIGLDDVPQWQHFLAALDKDGSPTAYLFRCRHCGVVGGYQDCD